jgi:ABC-2 type transport system permease protein
MRQALAVYTREVRSYFVSPIFYILAFVFMVVIGNLFTNSFFSFASQTMQGLRLSQNYRAAPEVLSVNMVTEQMFGYINFLFILIIPLITMRLYSEEKKSGTIELLMTSPLTTIHVLIGKFLSALTIYTCILAPTLAFNLIMTVESHGGLDWGPVLCSYLGSFLLGVGIIPIGMFFSSLTENQIVAAATTIAVTMGFWLMVQTSRYVNPPLSDIIRYLSISDHLEYFLFGVISIKHIFYFLSVSVFGLFLTGINVESARWRQ